MEPAVWMAGGGKGLFVLTPKEGLAYVDSGLNWPGILARGEGRLICACESQRQAALIPWEGRAAERLIPAPPGLEAMAARDGYLYYLSGETDTLLCCREDTGEPLYANRAGVYPRDLRLHPVRPLALTAGGAAGDVRLFALPGLELVRRVPAPGVVCQAAFVGDMIVVSCAIEEGDIHAMLGIIPPFRGAVEEVARMNGLPGAVLPLPDGTVLASALGALYRFSLKPPKLLWQKNRFGLIRHMELWDGKVLISDPLWEQCSLLTLSPPCHRRILATGMENFCIFSGA